MMLLVLCCCCCSCVTTGLSEITLNFRSELNTYRLLHMQKTAEMWNQVFEDHRKQSLNCGKGFLTWDLEGEKKMDYVGESGSSAQNVTSQILSICLRRKNRVTQVGV